MIKFERIYTVGCFDHFHYGHKILLQKMKEFGKTVIVGVHDDLSIEQLKNLKTTDHEDIQTRMQNVKQLVDVVY